MGEEGVSPPDALVAGQLESMNYFGVVAPARVGSDAEDKRAQGPWPHSLRIESH